MGGRVAMTFAKFFPERILSLILEDSGAESRPDREDSIQEMIGAVPTPFSSRVLAQLVTILAAGHFIHPVYPNEFSQAVKDFLCALES